MKRLVTTFATLALTLVPFLEANAATIAPGDLIKASGAAVYYQATDGKRYVFPNEKTYFTWYANFASVKTITDEELSVIQIGGNVTYRPGVKMLKITTDPKVYAMDGLRSLRWVQTEELARQLYGTDWAKLVHDLPDAFFVDYELGAAIAQTSDFVPAAARDAYPTIQTTLTATAPSPEPEPAPTPSPTPTSTTLSVTITTNKPEAQPNEPIDVLAQTDYMNGIERLEVYIDGSLYKTCLSAKSCGTNWVVPIAGTKSSYTYQAKLLTLDGKTAEATTSTKIVSTPVSPAVQMSAERYTIRPNQQPSIRSLVTGLGVSKNEIYLDGVAAKVCASYDCRYTNYLSGSVGATHTFYAIVTTPDALKYKSNAITVTIGTNDTPAVTFTPSKTEILSGETVDLTISASDDDGIGSTEILKDGVILKTCQGAIPCTVTTGPWSLPSGTVLTFDGRAYDLLSATTTAMTTVRIK